MNLDQQIQVLIDGAPQDGKTPQMVEMVAPVLKAVAEQLRHTQYYILQTLDQAWILTTLNNRTQPTIEKNVVYAFPTLKDVASGPYSLQDPQVLALPMPVTHILFQLISMPTVDSLVFFEQPGELGAGTEIKREDLHNLIQIQVQQSWANTSSNVPPDVA